MTVRVKACGFTLREDALAAADAGVDAVGLNFWPGSPRFVTEARGLEIADAVRGRVRIVGLFVEAPPSEVLRTRAAVGLDAVQWTGPSPERVLAALGPGAYAAVRLGGEADVALALAAPGDEVLVDAFVPGAHGGTGVLADWGLAARVAASRRTWLAGGLKPENVAAAVRAVRPFGVDVASGVEASPGVKDSAKMRAFVAAAKGAI